MTNINIEIDKLYNNLKEYTAERSNIKNYLEGIFKIILLEDNIIQQLLKNILPKLNDSNLNVLFDKLNNILDNFYIDYQKQFSYLKSLELYDFIFEYYKFLILSEINIVLLEEKWLSFIESNNKLITNISETRINFDEFIKKNLF